MRILLIGATGLLGQALTRAAADRGDTVVGAARRGAALTLDLAAGVGVRELLDAAQPDLVINAAALTNVDECEASPNVARAINAGGVGSIADICRDRGTRFLHVSTDHFFTGGRDRLHDEAAPIRLVNEYARSKFAGEALALRAPDALVVRTNFTGLRGWPGQSTFLEWVAGALQRRTPMALFDDFYTSTIDADALAVALLDLTDRRATGLLNVASRQVSHKKQFVEALAQAMGIKLDWATTASVGSLPVPRAESLGLDVSRAQALLGYQLPDLATVVKALARRWRQSA